MRELSSLKNPVIQKARALVSGRDRAACGAFLLDGEHMVGEALSARPEGVRQLFVDADKLERFKPLIQKAEAAGAAVYATPARVLEALSQVKTPQGIAAVCALPSPVPLECQQGRLLLLENVQDPGNVGTMLRTLDAAGFDGCVLTHGCADPYGAKAFRAAMGSAFRVPITFVENAPSAVAALNARGYATIGAALDGGPFYERDPLPEKLCVLIGNEGAGLTPETLAECAHRYRLPMRGGAESLNAAVAAAILMYELMNH